MHCPERYVKNNGIQQREAKDALTAYIEKMVWTSNEMVLDIGCGPGDVTSDILYPFLKNKIKQLVRMRFELLEIIISYNLFKQFVYLGVIFNIYLPISISFFIDWRRQIRRNGRIC